jgi:hypothetical protein
MTVAPVSGRAPTSTGQGGAHRRVARLAVALAALVVVAIAVSFAVFAVAYLVGGSDATEDNWVGYLAGVALLAGLTVSLAAFALALAARIGGERWALLWLPLSAFPALVAFLILGETLWWE